MRLEPPNSNPNPAATGSSSNTPPTSDVDTVGVKPVSLDLAAAVVAAEEEEDAGTETGSEAEPAGWSEKSK